MHWLDVTILIVLGIGAVFGFWSGLLWQVARVVSLLLSLYLAISANDAAADWLMHQCEDSSLALCRIAAFVLVFLLAYLVSYMITRLLHKAIKATKLETLDRTLGALLGMAKMGAIVSVVCAAVTALALPFAQGWIEESTLAPYFARGTDLAKDLIPAEYRKRLDDNYRQAREQMTKKVTETALDALKGKAAQELQP